MASQASVIEADAAPEAKAEAESPSKKNRVRAIALGVLGVGLVGVGAWYVMHAGLESTDDAQVDADVVAVPARVGGAVMKVSFSDNQVVKAGDVLVEIDSAQPNAKLQEAEAELISAKAAADAADAEVAVVDATARGQKSAAEASLTGASLSATTTADEIAQADAQVAAATVTMQQAQIDLDRQKKLYADNATPKQQLDHAQTSFDAAQANLAQAKAHQAVVHGGVAQAQAHVQEARARVGQSSAVDAQIAQARAKASAAHARVQTAQAVRDLAALDVSYTKILAPRDGIASKRSVNPGQMLSIGQQVVSIVPVNDVWITANFKETQLGRMKPNAPAEIEIDAYPGVKMHGEIESFSGATGARFSLLPPENATGNFTKVVQRVPVRIRLKDVPQDKPLRPGMSADVTVDVRK